MFRRLPLVLLAATVMSATGFAQGTGSYTAPQTPDGQPDIQGVRTTGFVTMLERPDGVDDLVVDGDQAQAVATAILGSFPEVKDPQLDWDGVRELAKVQGEYRTSQIVDPADGKIPYTPAGLGVALRSMNRNATQPEHAGHRALHPRVGHRARVSVHRRRRPVVPAAVDRRVLDDAVRPAHLRVRLPRRQLQPACRAAGRAATRLLAPASGCRER
jgi:hypothetical protein